MQVLRERERERERELSELKDAAQYVMDLYVLQ
jgi:hypothetical protein